MMSSLFFIKACFSSGVGGTLSVSKLQPCVCGPTKPVSPTTPGLLN